MSAVSAEAEHFIRDLGWVPVPLKPGDKRPVYNDWPNMQIGLPAVPRYFEHGRNLGLRLGQSKNVVDVDNDWPEALIVARYFLPPTDAMFGRASARMAHWLYTSSDLVADPKLPAAIQYRDPLLFVTKPKEAMIIELRIGGSKGAQSMVPPSIHPEGETLAWENGGVTGEPPLVAGDELRRCVARVAAASLLARYWPKTSGMHNGSRLLGGLLRRNGWPTPQITLFVEAICRAAGDADVKDRIRTARDAAEAFDAGKTAQGIPTLKATFGDEITKCLTDWLGLGARRSGIFGAGTATAAGATGPLPSIQLGPNLTEVAIAAEDAMLAAGLSIWQRDAMLVRPFVVDAHGAGGRKTRTGKLLQITPIMMRSYMEQAASFEKFDGRAKGYVACKPPADIAELTIARSGSWPFSPIRGILMAPSMRPDGTLIVAPGYDPETELYLLEPPPLPAIPGQPAKSDAEQALKLLAGLLEEFPFSGADSEAVAYSALITPTVRAALDRVPLHAITAPDIGTGKSFLVDLASAIATGFFCPVIGLGRDEPEFENRLGAALIAGHPLISIDNISRPLASDSLCRAIERPSHKVRVLGESRDVHVEPFFTAFATGNNLMLVGDIVRRTITCGLDRQEENPYLHRFSGNPLRTIAENRGVYIAACLTIVRAFRVSGEPPLPPLASFESWSDNVRSALCWLGLGDPVKTIAAAREEDFDRQNFIALHDAWKAVVGTAAITCARLVEKADMMKPFGSPGYEHPDLREALLAVAGDRGIINTVKLGQWLGRHRNVIVAGRAFRKVGDRTWQLG